MHIPSLPSAHELAVSALPGLQIVWINVLLSGDNAVVIALACRRLDRRRRTWAILGGSIVAVALRIVLTFFVVALLVLPYLKLLSGVLLLWIGIDLLRTHHSEEVDAAGSIWGAVRTIAVADVVMSLDNVVAVAAAAKNSVPLIVFGIALSVPLIIFGSTLILLLLRRFPVLVVLGAALLGWVAGEIIAVDPALARLVSELPPEFNPAFARIFSKLPPDFEQIAGAAGATFILLVAVIVWLVRRVTRPQPTILIDGGK